MKFKNTPKRILSCLSLVLLLLVTMAPVTFAAHKDTLNSFDQKNDPITLRVDQALYLTPVIDWTQMPYAINEYTPAKLEDKNKLFKVHWDIDSVDYALVPPEYCVVFRPVHLYQKDDQAPQNEHITFVYPDRYLNVISYSEIYQIIGKEAPYGDAEYAELRRKLSDEYIDDEGKTRDYTMVVIGADLCRRIRIKWTMMQYEDAPSMSDRPKVIHTNGKAYDLTVPGLAAAEAAAKEKDFSLTVPEGVKPISGYIDINVKSANGNDGGTVDENRWLFILRIWWADFKWTWMYEVHPSLKNMVFGYRDWKDDVTESLKNFLNGDKKSSERTANTSEVLTPMVEYAIFSHGVALRKN